MEEKWVELLKTYDTLEAEMIKDLLESGGIPVIIRSAKVTPYPVNIGMMGEVKILVQEGDRDRAEAAVKCPDDLGTASAAIDVGSNTIRLLIGNIRKNRVNRIYSGRITTRLAEGVVNTGRLKNDNIGKSVSAIKEFYSLISGCGIKNIRAVGTSAIREAENSKEFTDMVFNETGIKVERITGIEEARLTARGLLFGINKTSGPLLIIDIGGGSTEWIIQGNLLSEDRLLFNSLPAGVVKLLERFIKTDPPTPDELSAINNEIDSILANDKLKTITLISEGLLIGTGGTITTLASIDLGLDEYDGEKVHMHVIPLQKLLILRDMLISLPFDKRKGIKGLEPGRADLIIPGILLTIRVMEILGFKEITVSDYGLLEGILLEFDGTTRETTDEKSI
ncbi:MAG: DUF2007 domain-containing protein [Nitrospirota bacterium]